jgi:hypothetical protein
VETGGLGFEAGHGEKHKTLSEKKKKTKAKRVRGRAQVEEHLPSKSKVLSSSPSNAYLKKKLLFSSLEMFHRKKILRWLKMKRLNIELMFEFISLFMAHILNKNTVKNSKHSIWDLFIAQFPVCNFSN